VKEKKTKRTKPHFELPEDHWNRLKEAMRLRGSSASFFLREKIAEFLEEESSAEPPLTRYRKINCAGCLNSDNCKSDKTLENSCILAALYFSFSRRFGYGAHASQEWVSS